MIVVAVLSMVGRVTMLGISRWTDKGGSYRTVERFLNDDSIHWDILNYTISAPLLRDPNDVILISGDETITTKSGKHSFGLGRFFSSTHGVPVPGLCFLCI
ncbi:MAG: transposase, partial [Mariprofundaceae bacterium]|nr:transposase [Mariprofundaceae bacterium]